MFVKRYESARERERDDALDAFSDIAPENRSRDGETLRIRLGTSACGMASYRGEIGELKRHARTLAGEKPTEFRQEEANGSVYLICAGEGAVELGRVLEHELGDHAPERERRTAAAKSMG